MCVTVRASLVCVFHHHLSTPLFTPLFRRPRRRPQQQHPRQPPAIDSAGISAVLRTCGGWAIRPAVKWGHPQLTS